MSDKPLSDKKLLPHKDLRLWVQSPAISAIPKNQQGTLSILIMKVHSVHRHNSDESALLNKSFWMKSSTVNLHHHLINFT